MADVKSFNFSETVQGKLTLKKIAELKKKFKEDAYKAYTEGAKLFDAKVTVDIYGEEYTYGVTYVAPNKIAMSYQEIFECSHFDDNIKVFQGFYGAHSYEVAWGLLEKDLNACRNACRG